MEITFYSGPSQTKPISGLKVTSKPQPENDGGILSFSLDGKWRRFYPNSENTRWTTVVSLYLTAATILALAVINS